MARHWMGFFSPFEIFFQLTVAAVRILERFQWNERTYEKSDNLTAAVDFDSMNMNSNSKK